MRPAVGLLDQVADHDSGRGVRLFGVGLGPLRQVALVARRDFDAAITGWPASRSQVITPAQPDESAQPPCIRTTVGLGPAGRAGFTKAGETEVRAADAETAADRPIASDHGRTDGQRGGSYLHPRATGTTPPQDRTFYRATAWQFIVRAVKTERSTR